MTSCWMLLKAWLSLRALLITACRTQELLEAFEYMTILHMQPSNEGLTKVHFVMSCTGFTLQPVRLAWLTDATTITHSVST